MPNLDRSKFLGGSDAAGVLGLSRWATPLSVWAEKTGQYIRPDEDSEAKELGKELEDYVAKRFCRKMGKSVIRTEGTLFHPQYDFLAANLDRVVEGEDAILEAKTCSAWKSKEWEGEEIPQEYIAQCWHYMMVTGKRKAYIAVLIGNQDFKVKEILWEDKIMKEILTREVSFWNEFVLTGIMPSLITKKDGDILYGLFPNASEGKTVQLGDEANRLAENLIALKQDYGNMEGQIDLVENEIKALLKDAEVGMTSLYKIAWANQVTRRFDVKSFEEKYPDLAKQFKAPKASRRFTVRPIKGEGK